MGKKEPIDNGNCCFCGPKKKPTTFEQPVRLYLRLKRGTMQFTLVIPILALLVVFLDLYDVYENGEFDPAKSYVWIQLVKLVSALWAMFSLKDFLSIMQPDLEKLNVQANQKMLCIQGIILGLLLQGILISALFDIFDWSRQTYNNEDVNSFVAICEMTFVSFAHSHFFPHPQPAKGQEIRSLQGEENLGEDKDKEEEEEAEEPLGIQGAITHSLVAIDYVQDLSTVFGRKAAEKIDKQVKSYGTMSSEGIADKSDPKKEEQELLESATEDDEKGAQ